MNYTLKVLSFEKNHLDVFWELDTPTDSLDYEWRLLRSEGPAGPWDPLTGFVQEVYYYRDNVAPLISRVRQLFYVLEIKHRATGVTEQLGPSSLGVEPDLIGMELIRQVRMELRFSGRLAYLLPLRTVGPRCVSCYDAIREVRTRSRCPSCYDTSRVGGYLSPVKTEIDISEQEKDMTQTDYGEVVQTSTTGRMSNFPPAKTGDLIVTDQNERYRIEKMVPSEHRRSPYEQAVVLYHLPVGNAEYDIPLNIQSLQTYDSDPDMRSRVNPTDNKVDGEYIKFLLGTFGGVRL